MPGLVTSSGEKTASAQIYAAPSYLHNFEVNPPAIGLATVKIYDGTDSTGTMIASITVAAGQNSVVVDYKTARIANRGIYAALSGTTSYIVGFSPG